MNHIPGAKVLSAVSMFVPFLGNIVCSSPDGVTLKCFNQNVAEVITVALGQEAVRIILAELYW